MIFSREELSKIFKAEVQYGIDGISVDSRSIQKGDLYVALRGERVDGHDFIKQAIDRGAVLALSEREISEVDSSHIIQVESPYQGLVELAKYKSKHTDAKYICVTGSVGKTTTKNLIHHLLSRFMKDGLYVSKKNFNSQIGLPICAASMPNDTKVGIFEMGMSERGNISKLTDIIAPDVSIISQICATHLEFFNSVWDIAKAKSEIMDKTKQAVVIPADSPYTDFLKNKAKKLGIPHVYTFGFSPADATVISCEHDGDFTKVSAKILGREVSYKIASRSEVLVTISLSAILAIHEITSTDIQDLAAEVESFSNEAHGRGELFEKNGVTIIDDSYNACPESLKAAIRTLSRYPGRKILAVGDMRELGPNSKIFHAEISPTIDKYGIDLVFACGDLSKHLFDNLQEKKKGAWCENSQQLSEEIIKFIKPGDVILVKGSNSMKMNCITEAIKNVL